MLLFLVSMIPVSSASKILIDNAHDSYPVQDNRFDDFKELAEKKGFSVVFKGISRVNLQDYSLVILGNPAKKFSSSEIDSLKAYVDNGGILMVLGSADYKDRDYSEVTNAIMRGIGSDILFNDDEVADYQKNGGAWYNPLISNFKIHELTKGLSDWGFYSTQSLILSGDAEGLAFGNPSTENKDADESGDFKSLSGKKVVVLAIDRVSSGVVIAAGTWRVISGFRYGNSDVFSENVLKLVKSYLPSEEPSVQPKEFNLENYRDFFGVASIVVGSNEPHAPQSAARDEVDYQGALKLGNNLKIREVFRDTEMREYKGDLILVGGPEVNALTTKYLSFLPIGFARDEQGWYIEKDGMKYRGMEYGLIAVLDINGRKILIACGLGGTGTAGALKVLKNLDIYDFQRFLVKNEYGEAILLKVLGDTNLDGLEDEVWSIELIS
ncbi:MAG: hypothetical protein ACE5K0_01600 [Candidatus Methanofastidiosia archaeon]